MVAKVGKQSFWKTYRYGIAVILAMALYLPSITYDYTLDDAIVIYDNDFTQKGISGIPELLQYDTFRGFFKVEGKDKLVAGGRYRPLTPIMFALEYQLVGNNPWLSHLINVLSYGLLILVLLFFLENHVFEKKSSWKWAWVAVLLFAAHPIHSEVVANIKGRDEIISAILGLLAMHFLWKKNHWLSGLLLILSLLSKEMGLTWIAIAFGYFWIYKNQSIIQSIKNLLPWLCAFVVYLIIRFSVLGWPQESGTIMEMMNNPFIKLVGKEYVEFSFSEKIAAIFFALGKYIVLLFYPHPLTHDYYPRSISAMPLTHIFVMVSIAIHLAMIAAVFYFKSKNKIISFLIFFYLAGLILISNIFFPIGTHMGERFIFVSSIAFSSLMAYGFSQVKNSNITKLIVVVILVLYSIKTVTRIPVWKNDFTLFTTDVKTSNQSAKALNAAAGSLVDHCINMQPKPCSPDRLNQAIAYAQKAIEIHPNYKSAHLILGNAHILNQEYNDAIAHLKTALKIDPTLAVAEDNLMIAYVEAAKEWGETQGNTQKAIKLLLEANKRNPDHIEVLRLLGVAHGVEGNFSEALRYFEILNRKNPNDVQALRNIGITYMQMGEKEKGESYLQKAQQLEVDDK